MTEHNLESLIKNEAENAAAVSRVPTRHSIPLKNSSELETRIKVVSIDVYNFQNTLQ